LPKAVCRFISEDAFVRFCLEHRERLLKPAGQDDQETKPIALPPANET